MSCVVDVLVSLGFREIRSIGMIEELSFQGCYPIFKNLQIQTKRDVANMEIVEKVCFIDEFTFSRHSQTILYSEEYHFTDIVESDILVKTLFHDF